MANKIHIIHTGYSRIGHDDQTGLSFAYANCSCVLITGESNVIVDTMTPWDRELIVDSLKSNGLQPGDINFVISTHGHSDHIGNNNLFLNAKHVVGFCVSFKDKYDFHPFERGIPLKISEGISVIPTPGHTCDDVSVLVKTADLGTVIVAGDIFEREEDIKNPEIWRSEGGSYDPERQERSRFEILKQADWIVPGHGPMFKVTEEMRKPENAC